MSRTSFDTAISVMGQKSFHVVNAEPVSFKVEFIVDRAAEGILSAAFLSDKRYRSEHTMKGAFQNDQRREHR